MEKITLKNGLRIILNEQNTTKSACFGVWIKSGSLYEEENIGGISHFVEHMLFKGTLSRSYYEISKEMDYLGGQINAYTAKDYTCVYAKTLSEHVPKAFDIIADMVANPKFDEKDIDLEKGVVLEEIYMTNDAQDDKVAENLYKNVWHDHPLGRPILGEAETVKSFNRENLKDYVKKVYSPERTVISISGSFDKDEFLNIVEKYFGNIKNSDFKDNLGSAVYNKSTNIKEDLNSEQTHICICFPGFSSFDYERNALNILSLIAGGSASSRLFKSIRDDLALVYTIYSTSICYNYGGLFEIQTATSHNLAQKTLDCTIDVLKKLKKGVSKEEFCRAKEQLKSSVIMGLESNLDKAAFFGRSEILKNKIKTEDEILNELNSISIDEVNDIARDIIDFDKMSVSVIGKRINVST